MSVIIRSLWWIIPGVWLFGTAVWEVRNERNKQRM